jgi:hypothetical protein
MTIYIIKNKFWLTKIGQQFIKKKCKKQKPIKALTIEKKINEVIGKY